MNAHLQNRKYNNDWCHFVYPSMHSDVVMDFMQIRFVEGSANG